MVDVDTKNSPNVEKTRQLLDGLGVRIFAEVETPGTDDSGRHGRHFAIAGHPDLPSCSALDGWPGIDVLSHGRLVFLPGTQRPKYNDAEYRIIYDNLEALADGDDPDGAETFANWVAERQETQTPSKPQHLGKAANPTTGKPNTSTGCSPESTATYQPWAKTPAATSPSTTKR